MLPPAPARFSITKLVPSAVATFGVTSRASTSVVPPAPKGTMYVMGLLGHWPWA
jgi:hypothetical protein